MKLELPEWLVRALASSRRLRPLSTMYRRKLRGVPERASPDESRCWAVPSGCRRRWRSQVWRSNAPSLAMRAMTEDWTPPPRLMTMRVWMGGHQTSSSPSPSG